MRKIDDLSYTDKITDKEVKKYKKDFKKADKSKNTAQKTLAYKEIFTDGLCHTGGNHYTRTIQFEDINYQLSKPEDKETIFEQYCDFLNYFDNNINVQLTCINQSIDIKEITKDLKIAHMNDGFNVYRDEYSDMLSNQMKKGKNSIVKSKYLTFGIETDSKEMAIQRLSKIETEVRANFKSMGCSSQSLDGRERLESLHSYFNKESGPRFFFNWDLITKVGMSTQDFIAPNSFTFKDKNSFMIGDTYGAVSYIDIIAPDLPDFILKEILDVECNLIVNMHIRSIDQNRAMRNARRKISELNEIKIQEQKKAVKSGFDMDILPPELVTYIDEASNLLEDLQGRNERLFMVTITVVNTAPTKEQLNNEIFQIESIVQQFNCNLRRLEYQQEDGLISALPFGIDKINIKRALTSSATAIFIPFTTQELFDKNGMYYGLNAVSQNVIMCNRKKLLNPNGLFLGAPGSGKSFSAKREMVNVFLLTNDDIVIVDPEREYSALVHALGGTVVHISSSSKDYINPMDINLNYSEDDNPVSLKSDFILSLCELIVGGKTGLSAIERTIIDRCVQDTYAPYLQDPENIAMPKFTDFYEQLKKQKEPAAEAISLSLEIYVKGSLNVFNHATSVDTNRRIVCYDIKDLGKQLKKMGMLIVQDQIWNKLTTNRQEGKSTWYYIDEFHLLLKDEQTTQYSLEIWKRARKWGGIPTGITQNIKDLLASNETENIFDNSHFIYMLNQSSGDRKILAQALDISKEQLSHVTNSGEGEGLLRFGKSMVPFVDKFPKDTKLYGLMTTKLDEVQKNKKATDTPPTLPIDQLELPEIPNECIIPEFKCKLDWNAPKAKKQLQKPTFDSIYQYAFC